MNGSMAQAGDRIRYDGANEHYLGKTGSIVAVVTGVNHEQVRSIVVDVDGKEFATYADCLTYLGPEA